MKSNSDRPNISGLRPKGWITAGPIVALALCLSGCNPAPKYAKPPAQTPVAFKESAPQEYKEGEGWKMAQPGDDKIRGKWWEIYNDPQLNAIEEQVQVNNQSIAAAEANFRAARALVNYARAALFPSLGASPSYTNSRFSQTSRGSFVVGGQSVNSTSGSTSTGASSGTGSGSANGGTSGSGGSTSSTGVGGSSNTGVLNNFSFPIDLSYTVDLWHRIRNNIDANAYTAQASAADVSTALLSTQAEVAQDYFQIRALDTQRAILQDTVENYRQTLDLTMARFRGGIASDEDVSQAQTQLNTTIAQSTDLGVARAQLEHAIAMLVGRPAANFSLPVAPFVPHPPAVPVALPSLLLERRPDIAAAERRVAAANAQIGIAKAAYYPNLTFSATAGFQSSQFTQWFNWPSRFWSLGPDLAGTIFDGGARRALTEQARASYDSTVANYRQAVLTSFQAVEDNLAALRILSDELVQQRTALQSANHFLDLSLTRYRGGVDSYLTVITAQNTVLNSREAEVQIELRQMLASVSLIMAVGGGWDQSQLPRVEQVSARPPKNTSPQSPDTRPQPMAVPNPPPVIAPVASTAPLAGTAASGPSDVSHR